MAREFDGSYQPNAKSRKQQEKDQRRMEFRRAIETYSEQRRLLQEIADYPELQA
ncbi:MAG: PA3496 family putative envelope integrity protein, partial [Pseudomonas sp.]